MMLLEEMLGKFEGVGCVESFIGPLDFVGQWEINFNGDDVDFPDKIFALENQVHLIHL